MTAAATNEPASIFVSLELSKRSWLTATLKPGTDRVSIRSFPGGDVGALLAYLTSLQGQVQTAIGGAAVVKLCYEVGYDGFWLARLLKEKGVDPYVLDPASFLVSRRGKRVKTDRTDAEAMVWILKSHVGGDPSVCRAVRVPTPEEEDAKRLMRERGRLVGERTAHIGRIRALLALHGIRVPDVFRGGDGMKKVDEMRTGDGRVLPPHLRREIEREFRRLALVNDQLKELEVDRSTAVAQADASFPASEKVTALTQLKGIGSTSATMLTAEVFHRSFEGRRQLTSFIGLSPTPFASGDVDRDQGISKAGNKPTRVLLVELAWCWLRYQPASDLTLWYRSRFVGRGARAAKVGIVALARKLLIALWRFVETGLVPTGAELRAAA
jgi:transposase